MNRNAAEKPRPAVLAEFPVVIRIPIQWGDLDVYGHVNNVVYLRWFEAARAAYAMRVGVEILSRNHGVGAILASISCNYRRPLAYPGEVLSAVRVTRVTVGSVRLEYLVADARTGVTVADGDSHVVLYDYTTEQPVPVPDQIRSAVELLEGKSFPL
jgi:acyl-CoA thioester hydrolase